MRLFVYDTLVNVNVIYYVHVCDMLVNVNVIYYVHVCQQARWARSAGNSAIENLCIIIITVIIASHSVIVDSHYGQSLWTVIVDNHSVIADSHCGQSFSPYGQLLTVVELRALCSVFIVGWFILFSFQNRFGEFETKTAVKPQQLAWWVKAQVDFCMHINGGVTISSWLALFRQKHVSARQAATAAQVHHWAGCHSRTGPTLGRLPQPHRPHTGQAATATQAPHWAGCHSHTGPTLGRLPQPHRSTTGQAATTTQVHHWAGCHNHTGPTLGRLSGIPWVYETLLGGCSGYPECMRPCLEGV